MSRMNMQATKIISVTSGKGGVGKTTLLSNMALCLAQRGKKVLILDGDLGLANVEIMFGMRPQGTLQDVISGQKEMSDILTEVSKNVFLISGGSGSIDYNKLNHFERRALLEGVRSLKVHFDYLLIDTAPGISDNVLFLNSAAQEVALVITPEPASFADSYAMIKVLNQKFKMNHFSIICNQVVNEAEGLALFTRFNDIVNKFLCVGLDYWGTIPMDSKLRKATLGQRLVVRHDLGADSSRAIKAMSQQIDLKEQYVDVKGGLQGFWDELVGSA